MLVLAKHRSHQTKNDFKAANFAKNQVYGSRSTNLFRTFFCAQKGGRAFLKLALPFDGVAESTVRQEAAQSFGNQLVIPKWNHDSHFIALQKFKVDRAALVQTNSKRHPLEQHCINPHNLFRLIFQQKEEEAFFSIWVQMIQSRNAQYRESQPCNGNQCIIMKSKAAAYNPYHQHCRKCCQLPVPLSSDGAL